MRYSTGYRNANRIKSDKKNRRKKLFSKRYKKEIEWLQSTPTVKSDSQLVDILKVLTSGDTQYTYRMKEYMVECMNNPRFQNLKTNQSSPLAELDLNNRYNYIEFRSDVNLVIKKCRKYNIYKYSEKMDEDIKFMVSLVASLRSGELISQSDFSTFKRIKKSTGELKFKRIQSPRTGFPWSPRKQEGLRTTIPTPTQAVINFNITGSMFPLRQIKK